MFLQDTGLLNLMYSRVCLEKTEEVNLLSYCDVNCIKDMFLVKWINTE